MQVQVPPAAATAAESADAKLGHDTVVLGMTELFGVVDAFVITEHAEHAPRAHAGRRDRPRGKRGTRRRSHRVEGLQDATWVLMDYGDFIAHVFLQETRDYYDLEHLWSGAPRVPWRRDVENAG